MARYRKKPVVIEAFTFDEFLQELGKAHTLKERRGVTDVFWSYDGYTIRPSEDGSLIIPTLEGDMKLTRGDMLIIGVNGEIYPCKLDIFEQTYERVNEPALGYGVIGG